MTWKAQAACRGMETALFFGEVAQSTLAVCRACPVQAECLEEGLDQTSDAGGVWGGLTEDQRDQVRRDRDRQANALRRARWPALSSADLADPGRLFAIVARALGREVGELVSARTTDRIEDRQVAIAAVWELTGASTPTLARVAGFACHSSARHALAVCAVGARRRRVRRLVARLQTALEVYV